MVSACDKGKIPAGVTLAVTVLDVVPSHPTREQLNADPALDPVQTRFLGGADLAGYLRDSKQPGAGDREAPLLPALAQVALTLV